MSGWTQADVDRIRNKRQATIGRTSKYRNVKAVIHGETFDSKREAAYWVHLKAREVVGEIYDLRRQVPFDLLCPHVTGGEDRVVSRYIADFTFNERPSGQWHVVDAKGKRTALYALKAKWLFLQTGLVIEEV